MFPDVSLFQHRLSFQCSEFRMNPVRRVSKSRHLGISVKNNMYIMAVWVGGKHWFQNRYFDLVFNNVFAVMLQ